MKYAIINKLTTFVHLAVHIKMLTGSEAAGDREESVPAALPLRGIAETAATGGESLPEGGGGVGLISRTIAFNNCMLEPGCLHQLVRFFFFLQVFKSSPHVKS